MSSPNIPSVLYTDLAEGPNTGGRNNNGEIITLSGFNFGTTRTGAARVTLNGVEVADYLSWSDTKIVIQPGASCGTGNFEVRNSSGLTSRSAGVWTKPDGSSNDFTVRAGTIIFVSPGGSGSGTFASPMAPSSMLAALDPGVTVYFRGGSYTTRIGQTNWSDYNIVLGAANSGTSGNRIQFVGYPGETAAFSGLTGVFHFRDSGTTVQDPAIGYFTIANIDMTGSSTCVGGGAYTSGTLDVYHSGARSVRVVNCRMRATYGSGANTATGLLSIGHDGWRVLGNEFYNTGVGAPVNNNHIVYVQCGSGDCDIAYNWIHDVRVGHTIQVHTDTPFTYLGVRIHHNLVEAGTTGQCRGMTSSNNLDGTTGAVYGNVFANIGDGVSAVTIMSGTWNIFNNTFYNISGDNISIYGAYFGVRDTNAVAVISNNIVNSSGSSAYIGYAWGGASSQVSGSNNLFFNNGAAPGYLSNSVNSNPLFVNAAAGDFTLQSTSPARNAGTASVSSVMTHDRRGIAMPQGASYDIGAYEFV